MNFKHCLTFFVAMGAGLVVLSGGVYSNPKWDTVTQYCIDGVYFSCDFQADIKKDYMEYVLTGMCKKNSRVSDADATDAKSISCTSPSAVVTCSDNGNVCNCNQKHQIVHYKVNVSIDCDFD